MTVRAIVDTDIPAVVALWNTQQAIINADLPTAIWTEESCAAFLSMAFAHRIDDANGSFAVLAYDPRSDSYEFSGGTNSLLGLARVMKALVALLPPDAQLHGDVPASSSKTLRKYFSDRYTATRRTPRVTRYSGVVADVVAKA